MGRLAKNLSIIGAGTVLILLSVAVMALIGAFYDATYPFGSEYAIVIDAGSSSSKFYLYSWSEGLSVALGEEVNIEQDDLCTQSPGLDKVPNSKEAMTLYFEKCINQIRLKIPAHKRNRTYITLGATAGMRLLNSSNSQLASSLIGLAQDYLSHLEFYFPNSSQARIISGAEEGLFAWITGNYFIKSFGSKNRQTYGILDLGGASSQIGYLPDNANQIANNATVAKFLYKIRIYGINYDIYSSSYLCYGVDQFLLVYQAYVIKLANYENTATAACFQEGASINVTSSALLQSNCANGNAFNFPDGGIDTNQLGAKTYYTINGLSDVEECQNQISQLFPTDKCDYGSCSFNNVFLPNQTGNYFYGFSNFYYAINNTEILSGLKLKKNFALYKNQSDYLCSLNYTELKIINDGEISDRFLRTVCFNNHIVINLLTNFKIVNLENAVITLDVNGNAIGWSVGFLLNQINRDDFLPSEEPKRKIPREFFLPAILVSGTLTGFLLITLIIFIIYIIQN